MKTATGKTRKQTQAIAALLESNTIAEAASKCGVTARTLQNWLASPKFVEQYRKAKSELLETTINRLRSIGGYGVEALRTVATDENAGDAARVSAGRAILETLLRAVAYEDLEQRIQKLESERLDDDV